MATIGACSPYAEVTDLPEGCPCIAEGSGGDTPSEDQLSELLAAASDIVWSVLGRQDWGECEETIWPCRQTWGYSWDRHNWPSYDGISPRSFAHCCGEGVLLTAPVIDVTEVVVAGDVLDPSDYVLRDGLWLERVGGGWPSGSRDDLDAFRITYTHGHTVPVLVRDATIEVANELWLDRCGSGSNIPNAVSSASARGTSYDYSAQRDRVEQAGSALEALWKAKTAYNPTAQPVTPLVYSPDEPYRNHRYRTFA